VGGTLLWRSDLTSASAKIQRTIVGTLAQTSDPQYFQPFLLLRANSSSQGPGLTLSTMPSASFAVMLVTSIDMLGSSLAWFSTRLAVRKLSRTSDTRSSRQGGGNQRQHECRMTDKLQCAWRSLVRDQGLLRAASKLCFGFFFWISGSSF
jgi:hypothetical protein